jgi:hypothetical protein
VRQAVSELARRRDWAVENVLRDHLREHDVLDFVRTIRRLEQALGQCDSGIRPHRAEQEGEG